MTSLETRPALIDLISAMLGHPIVDAVVRNNELPIRSKVNAVALPADESLKKFYNINPSKSRY
jgi:hypothetical protein